MRKISTLSDIAKDKGIFSNADMKITTNCQKNFGKILVLVFHSKISYAEWLKQKGLSQIFKSWESETSVPVRLGSIKDSLSGYR